MLYQIFQNYNMYNCSVYIAQLCVLILVPACIQFWQQRNVKSNSHKASNLPPMLPYKIPFIGHSISFLLNSEKLISYGREYFGDTRKIFSINLRNKTTHILTNPGDVAIVHSKATSFELKDVLKSALVAYGASREAVNLIWDPRKEAGILKEGIVPASHKFQIRQTSGENLKGLLQHICGDFTVRTSQEALASAQVSQQGVESLHIMDWAREKVAHAMIETYFGPKLYEIDASLPLVMIEFSDLAWQAWYSLPWFLRRHQIKLCDRLRSVFRQWLDIPKDERTSRAWFTQYLEKECSAVLEDKTDMAAVMLNLAWGTSMNPADAAGWLAAHVTYDVALADTIRKETAPAFKIDSSLDTFYLINSCPVLMSVWFEVLRFYTSVTTMRTATEDTFIGDTYFQKGSELLFSARQLALNRDVFSDNAAEFDHMRFFRNPELQHNESFRPFGGGKSMCPGRHIAVHVATALVAILLRRYDVSPAFPQNFPHPFEDEPSIGLMRTKDRLYIKLESRE